MTQDEIIEMYLQVSKKLCNDTEWCSAGVGEPLQMFAKLVAAKAEAKEREACAKVCAEDSAQAMDFTYGTVVGGYFAEIIRVRGEA